MADYQKFVDWVVVQVPLFWNLFYNAHFIFKALLLSPFLLMIVKLIYDTFHSDV